jgi:hypothetical protein
MVVTGGTMPPEKRKRDLFWVWWLVGIPMPPRKTRQKILSWIKSRQSPEVKIPRLRKQRSRLNRFNWTDRIVLVLSVPLLLLDAGPSDSGLVAKWRRLPGWGRWTMGLTTWFILMMIL